MTAMQRILREQAARDRREAREVLSVDAQVKAVYYDDTHRRGKARTKRR